MAQAPNAALQFNQKPAAQATNTIGSLKGSFQVTPTGAASYSIPIAVPPGTAGLAPALSITYLSQQGNGMLGMGFSLTGLTKITRCPSSLAKNGVVHGVNYTDQDRFCFNGEQLVAVKGAYGADRTEYRTYLDTNSKIISYGRQGNGPARFKVWSKGGQVAEYGFTNDAQIYAQGKSTIATFALNKITDTAGNYLLVKYLKDDVNGAFYPSEIDYTGNAKAKLTPYNKVKFLYENRPDIREAYRAGSVMRLTKRLSQIQIFSSGKLVYAYKLNYGVPSINTGRSVLRSIQECSGKGICLPATTFAWQETQNPTWQGYANYILSDPLFLNNQAAGAFADLNNDGLPDYVMSIKEKDKGKLKEKYLRRTWLNTGVGWQEAGNYLLPDVLMFEGHRAGTLLDLNGDGAADYIMSIKERDAVQRQKQVTNPQERYFRGAFLSLNNSWQNTPSYLLPDALTFEGDNAGEFADLNGDHRPDYVMSIKEPDAKSKLKERYWRGSWLNTGAGWQGAGNYTLPDALTLEGKQAGTLVDLNGDGLADYVLSIKTTSDTTGLRENFFRATFLNTGSGWQNAGANYLLPDIFNFEGASAGTFVDLNGDGLADYVLSLRHGKDFWQGAWINTGRGWQGAPNYVLPFAYSSGGAINGTFADLNGDGLADYIVSYVRGNDKHRATWLNTGHGWVAASNYTLPNWLINQGGLVDLNGDGLPDYIISVDNVHSAWLNTQQKSDLLINVTNGLSAKLNFTYQPLTNKTIYHADHNAQYPNTDLTTPLYVITQTQSATLSNDSKTKANNNGMHITNYTYQGAKINNLGFGFLGFRQIIAQDQSTGIKVITTYSQNIKQHNIGKVLSTETHLASGTLIASTQNIWGLKIFGNGSPNQTYYLPYTNTSINKSFTLSGNLVSTKTTNITIDDYANPTAIITTLKDASGAYSTTTNNTYTNDPDKWLLSALIKAQVTATAPKQKPIIRTSAYAYDAQTGMLKQTITEPDDPKYRLVTDYKRDAFGNILKTTVSGADIETRTTANNTYDSSGRFIIESKNALEQATKQTFDERFGKPLTATDANGLTTTYHYDDFGRLIEKDYPDGTKTNIAYSWDNAGPAGSIYSITTHKTESPTQTAYYDALKRELATTTQGLNSAIIWRTKEYDDLGRVVQSSAPYFENNMPQYTHLEYDVLGRVKKTIHPNSAITTVTYNGLTTTVTNALGQKATKILNARGKLLQGTDNLNHSVFYQYDPFGNLIKVTDSAGNVTTLQYDRLGRRIALHDPDKGNWTYHYNVLGELISQTNALSQTTTFQYDKLGRRIRRTDPAGTSAWQYDTAPHGIGKLAKVNGITGAHGEKPTAQEIIHALSDGLMNYKRAYVYDELSRPTQTILTISDHNYISKINYDSASRPAHETFPSGLQIERVYNDLGYLIKIENAKTKKLYWQVNAMDALGHILSETHSNGLITNYTYDAKTNFLTDIKTTLSKLSFSRKRESRSINANLRLQKQLFPALTAHQTKSIKTQIKPRVAQKLHYDYDTLGNVKSRQDAVNKTNENFTYDGLNRLSQATLNGTKKTTWQYDALGNITYKSDIGNYIYGEHGAGPHALTSVTGDLKPSQFFYNKNGDQISATINGASRTLSYTSYSKPYSIINAKGSTTFYYNADRARFERVDRFASGKTVTTLYMGDFELTKTRDRDTYFTEAKHYIGPNTLYIEHQDSKSSSKKTLELLHDNLGSITDITDANANILEHFYYTPFGEQKITKGNPPPYPITHHGFTAQEEVEMSSLIHLNGRIYDPVFGRFLSADPFVQNPADEQTLNRYSYCINNPLRYTDPSGYNFFDDVMSDLGNLIHDVGIGVGKILQNPEVDFVIETAAAYFSGGAAWYVMPLVAGSLTAANGGDFAASMKSAALAFIQVEAWSVTQSITSGMGKAKGWSSITGKGESALIHGAVGGTLSATQGGSFQDGFISAAVTDAAGSQIDSIAKENLSKEAILERSAAAGVLGITVAALTGGNFISGAATATFSRMFSESAALYHQLHNQHATDQNALEKRMGPNAIVFAERPLEAGIHGRFSFADWFSHALHIDIAHEEVFYTDNKGHLQHIGFNGGGSGIHADEEFKAQDLSNYHFSPISRHVSVTNALLHPANFINPASYNLITHNCQYYADTIRRSLQLDEERY